MINTSDLKIAIIGLGYVGLPLAVEFGSKVKVLGYDINKKRVEEINNKIDSTLEVLPSDLESVINLNIDSSSENYLYVTSSEELLDSCNFYIITVPTPVDKNNTPNLRPLISATKLVGKKIKKGDFIIYESTVYPGATEEDCLPILEEESGLKVNKDFFIGYSPERINPGDKKHTLTNIKKITSGSNQKAAIFIDSIYKKIIKAGTFLASSNKVAEAAKVIENSQRDINIAFVNELNKIFNKMNINTLDVLEAASTKWNFLPFKPGLVGGHCIGVDPFYLAQKAQEIGYNPEIILAGRRINDSMPEYYASDFLKKLLNKKINPIESKICLMGITFKENCPDIRNSKAVDLYYELLKFNLKVSVYDPVANKDEVEREYDIKLLNDFQISDFDSLIFAVSHAEFKELKVKKLKGFIYDIKGIFKNDKIKK